MGVFLFTFLLVSTLIAPDAHAGSLLALGDASIEQIARKYQPTRAPERDDDLPAEYKRLQERLRALYERTLKEPLAKFLMDNFYPDLKGVAVIISGQSITPRPQQMVDMRQAEAQLEEVWQFRKRIATGPTNESGRATAELMIRFAGRTDIYEINKDTGTRPFDDLKGDISRLPAPYAYRSNWAFEKLNEIRNPSSVTWSPTAHFQLGEENQNFIRGFMEVQYEASQQRTSSEGSGVVLSGPVTVPTDPEPQAEEERPSRRGGRRIH